MYILAETYVELVEEVEDCLHGEIFCYCSGNGVCSAALALANRMIKALDIRVLESFASVDA